MTIQAMIREVFITNTWRTKDVFYKQVREYMRNDRPNYKKKTNKYLDRVIDVTLGKYFKTFRFDGNYEPEPQPQTVSPLLTESINIDDLMDIIRTIDSMQKIDPLNFSDLKKILIYSTKYSPNTIIQLIDAIYFDESQQEDDDEIYDEMYEGD